MESRWKLPFFTVWTSQSLSLFGSAIVRFALIWWLTKTTGKATTLGIATAVTFLPMVVLGPFAGLIIDRVNRKAVLIVADSAIAIFTLLLGLLFLFERVQIWHVYTAILVRAIGNTIHNPTMLSTTSLMVPQKYLTRIGGLSHTRIGVVNFVAPSLGALLIELIGVKLVLLVDIGTAAIAVAALFFVAIPRPERKVFEGSRFSESIRDLSEGFKYLWRNKGVRYILVTIFIARLLAQPVGSFMPLLVMNHFGGGALHLGWFQSTQGAAIIIGGAVLTAWGGFRRKIVTSSIGFAGIAAGFLILALASSSAYWFALVGVFLFGFSMPHYSAPLNAIFQTIVPAPMQGRFFAVYQSLYFSAGPIAMLAAGPLADLVGIRSFYLIGAIALGVIACVRMLIPSIMHIEETAVKKSSI